MELLNVVGLLTVVVLTPGPNSLLVMREASRAGWRAAFAAASSILLGGLALLAAVMAGASALFEREPRLVQVLGLAACLVLIAFGAAILRAGSASDSNPGNGDPIRGFTGLGGLFLLQFLNPKAWIMAIAVASSAGPGTDQARYTLLFAIFALISACGLVIWSIAGRYTARYLRRPLVRAWFDRTAGALLIGFALSTLIGGFHAS